jgi:hypothetical protein
MVGKLIKNRGKLKRLVGEATKRWGKKPKLIKGGGKPNIKDGDYRKYWNIDEIDKEIRKSVSEIKKKKPRLRGEIGPQPPKVKNNPKLNLQIRTKLKELEAADKRKKKKPKKKTPPKKK